jgi:transcriptional regulator with XRE-family HTH domain
MFNKNIFCERILELRKLNNLSQQQLADIVGVSYHAISKIENKQRAASIEVVYAIAENLNISSDYLLGLSDIKDRR